MSKTVGKQRQVRGDLLDLPAELRLNIYDLILGDDEAVTISGREIVDEEGDVDPEESSASNVSWRRVRRVPIIKNFYDESLLAIAPRVHPLPAAENVLAPGLRRRYRTADELAAENPTIGYSKILAASTKSETKPEASSSSSTYIPAHLALQQTCKQIYQELQHHMSSRTAINPILYVTYPHGVIVLKEHCPHLLKQARAINICGPFLYGKRPHECTGYWCCPGQAWKPSQPLGRTENPATLLAATESLTWLVRSVLSPKGHPVFERLEMRIFYPEADAYREVWTNNQSPISVALPNICGGKIDMEVWRSKMGAGVFLRARPQPRARELSTGWRKLGDTRAENEGFVLSDQWGKSEEDIPTNWKDSNRREETEVGITTYSGTRFSGNGGSY
ncbi:hypothetical protein NA57DRAFT_57951 [Rhizodiscina lignyota]|uniref:Uncharacterized protein n=1 Tax=Rhizodiscina lignyota TaxID=1504668 RepID=A0A9P4M509_9PEZI|nr:hypothetical protein NA57DRAFT_57951 [Rhizodiscina lignyota]